MIKVVFGHSDDTVTNISVTGHAGFGRHGTDIVCAAVSASVLMTANAISSLELDDTVQLDLKEGVFKLKVQKANRITQGLLKTLVDAITQMQQTYPKHITIRKED